MANNHQPAKTGTDDKAILNDTKKGSSRRTIMLAGAHLTGGGGNNETRMDSGESRDFQRVAVGTGEYPRGGDRTHDQGIMSPRL